MTVFLYNAYDGKGRAAKGQVEAVTEIEALQKIRRMGLVPYFAEPAESKTAARTWLSRDLGRTRLSLTQRAHFVQLLAAMLRSGIALDKATRILAADTSDVVSARIANEIAEKLAEGKSLSGALLASPHGFAGEELGLIQSGEQTGNVAAVLEELSELLRRRIELRAKILSASIYPAILAVMVIASLAIITTVLVPTIAPLYEQSGRQPPALVRFVIFFREHFANNALQTMGGIAAALVSLVLVLRTPGSKNLIQKLMYRLSIPKLLERARVCRTLGTLIRHKVQLQKAISMAANAALSQDTREQLANTADQVTSGKSLSSAMTAIHVLDRPSLQMIGVGEETNTLDVILLHIATTAEATAERKIERLMTLLTPLMTVGMGLLVGGLMMSVMRAIYSVNEIALP